MTSIYHPMFLAAPFASLDHFCEQMQLDRRAVEQVVAEAQIAQFPVAVLDTLRLEGAFKFPCCPALNVAADGSVQMWAVLLEEELDSPEAVNGFFRKHDAYLQSLGDPMRDWCRANREPRQVQ